MRRIIYTALLSLAVAHPASAQQQVPEPESEEVVVTGVRDVERQARDFVDALTPARVRGQIARFEGNACPAAYGLNAGQKAVVEARLRRLAEAAGAPLGNMGCSPNAILMVVDDKRSFLAELRRRHPHYFGALTPREVRRLVGASGPVAAWQLNGTVDARGISVEDTGDAASAETRSARNFDAPSRITPHVRPAFQATALVVERGALQGLTTTQLADYAAMRLLARTEPERLAGSSANSILTIIDAPMGSAVPITLTTWDLAFLRGLYAGNDNLYAAEQRSQIRRRMLNELRQPQEKDGEEEQEQPTPRR